MKRVVLSSFVIAAVLTTGCTQKSVHNFNREAGALVDTGHFGNATMDNHHQMTNHQNYTYGLAQRFASEVKTTVTFGFNSAVLDADARAVLQQQARWIRQFPEIRFRVYGHTDKVGSAGYNKRLGMRRARSVVNYLASLGIKKSRLEAVVSFGETQPLIVTEGRERRNRRTVTEVSGFVEEHPTVLSGHYASVIFREYVNSAVPKSTVGGGGDGALKLPSGG